HISNDFPNTRIIMLSGYDEFEYARQAIRLDIEDYLLKPVDIDELTLLVKKVKRNIINQKKEEKNQTENYIVQQLHHHLFGSPIYSQDTRRDRSVISSYYIIVSEICNYYLLKKSLTNTELSNLREKWKWKIKEAFSRFEENCLSIFGQENELITILYNHKKFTFDKEKIINTCQFMERVNGYSLRKIISSKQDNLSDLACLRSKMSRILEDGRADNEIIIMMEECNKDKTPATYPKNEERHIYAALLQADKASVIKILDDMFEKFKVKKFTLLQVLNVSRELDSVLKNRIQAQHYDSLIDQRRLLLHQDVDLKIYNSLQAIKHLFIKDLIYLMNAIDAKKSSHWIIKSAKNYIERNYQENIKALDIAEQHFITPNYFSKLFKQETGYRYSEFLNEIRIKKACELLETKTNKIYEIAEYVGYKEYKYFVHIFKMHIGMTPTQYRHSNMTKY